MGVQAGVIELPHANLVLLDSGKRGVLGEEQLDWLAKELDQRADKPALIFGHFNPYPNRGVRPIKGMRDGPIPAETTCRTKACQRLFLWPHP